MKVLRKLKILVMVSLVLLTVSGCGRQMLGVDGYYRGAYGYGAGSCDFNAVGENVYVGELFSQTVPGRIVLRVMPSMNAQFSASAAVEIAGQRLCCNSQGLAGVFGPPLNGNPTMSGVQLICHSMNDGTSYYNHGHQQAVLTLGVGGVSGYPDMMLDRQSNRVVGGVRISSSSHLFTQMPNFGEPYFFE